MEEHKYTCHCYENHFDLGFLFLRVIKYLVKWCRWELSSKAPRMHSNFLFGKVRSSISYLKRRWNDLLSKLRILRKCSRFSVNSSLSATAGMEIEYIKNSDWIPSYCWIKDLKYQINNVHSHIVQPSEGKFYG